LDCDGSGQTALIPNIKPISRMNIKNVEVGSQATPSGVPRSPNNVTCEPKLKSL
jgi:hypothetical protein